MIFEDSNHPFAVHTQFDQHHTMLEGAFAPHAQFSHRDDIRNPEMLGRQASDDPLDPFHSSLGTQTSPQTTGKVLTWASTREDIIVTGVRNTENSDDGGGYDGTPSYGDSGGIGSPGASGGGGGTTGVQAGVVHYTPEHHTYIVDISLTAQQAQVLDQIVDYGLDHGFNASEIAVVAADAYYESSFSQSAVNGSHIGTFQYNQSTWTSNGYSGSINNLSDQISAMFTDISRYETRYSDALGESSTGLAAAGLTFGQYFEIKHELGNNATDWSAVNPQTGNTYVSDWAGKYTALHIR